MQNENTLVHAKILDLHVIYSICILVFHTSIK